MGSGRECGWGARQVVGAAVAGVGRGWGAVGVMGAEVRAAAGAMVRAAVDWRAPCKRELHHLHCRVAHLAAGLDLGTLLGPLQDMRMKWGWCHAVRPCRERRVLDQPLQAQEVR